MSKKREKGILELQDFQDLLALLWRLRVDILEGETPIPTEPEQESEQIHNLNEVIEMVGANIEYLKMRNEEVQDE